jgi:hypothetical protein
LFASRTFQAPAYVNSDCGAKALAFDRIQVNALVRIVTAAAGMVEVGVLSMSRLPYWKEGTPHSMWGRFSWRQYSSANMIVSTRVTTGSPFGFLTSGSSYKSILKKITAPSALNDPKSCSPYGSLALQKPS